MYARLLQQTKAWRGDTEMKVLLVDVDSKIGNPPLMKIARKHKLEGDLVYLRQVRNGSITFPYVEPDKVYVSCVFSQNKQVALKVSDSFSCEVEVGGYGVNDKQLPYEIEHLMPYYKLYGIDYSIGFSSRGCIRTSCECPWCIVPKKEGAIRNHAPISEFLHPRHRKLVLLDNNFLASPRWNENLEFIVENRLQVNFNQGLDIRLVDDEKAKWLSLTNFRTFTFKTEMLHFAFDTPQIEDELRRGVAILKKHGVPPRKLTFYFLCGFNTTHEQDMHRFKIIRELGANPYCMKYNDRQSDPWLNHFDRWVNTHPPLYKVCKFQDYKPLTMMMDSPCRTVKNREV